MIENDQTTNKLLKLYYFFLHQSSFCFNILNLQYYLFIIISTRHFVFIIKWLL